mgnify:FL=1
MTHKRALLVEDDADHLYIFSHVVQKAGYAVDLAANMRQAEAMLAGGHHYDLFICDMRLPDGRGFDLLREQHARLQAAGTVIVVISAEDHYRQACEALGIEYFLVKPVLPSMFAEFLKRINR